MITHKNLVDAIQQCREWWSCPAPSDSEPCPVLKPCKDCAEKLVTKYENALREEGKQMALADLAKHDKEVIRKFAEWAYDHSIIDGVRTKEARIAKYIEEYEKQMKEGGENG